MTSDESERRKDQSVWRLNIEKTKIMTTKEIHNFNIHHKDLETVKDLAYPGSVIDANGNCSQEFKRRLRLGRAAAEE